MKIKTLAVDKDVHTDLKMMSVIEDRPICDIVRDATAHYKTIKKHTFK